MLKSLLLLSILLLSLLPARIAIPNLPQPVLGIMASRQIRYHHYVWHNVRNLWNVLDGNTRREIASYGWAPPRPALDSNKKPLTDNGSGEDFLYFHRTMIATVNNLLQQYGFSPATGFAEIPAPDDNTYPLPRAYNAPTSKLTDLVKQYKSYDWYRKIKAIESKLNNPNYLRSVTLSQLGSYIEYGSKVHEALHFRFSERANLMRVTNNKIVPFIDYKWDSLQCNWLADIYSSQVSPWFWKIHGWMDNAINNWARANNVQQINWQGTWLGGNMGDLPGGLRINTQGVDIGSNVQGQGQYDVLSAVAPTPTGDGGDNQVVEAQPPTGTGAEAEAEAVASVSLPDGSTDALGALYENSETSIDTGLSAIQTVDVTGDESAYVTPTQGTYDPNDAGTWTAEATPENSNGDANQNTQDNANENTEDNNIPTPEDNGDQNSPSNNDQSPADNNGDDNANGDAGDDRRVLADDSGNDDGSNDRRVLSGDNVMPGMKMDMDANNKAADQLMNSMPGMPNMDMDVLEKLARILMDTGLAKNYFSELGGSDVAEDVNDDGDNAANDNAADTRDGAKL